MYYALVRNIEGLDSRSVGVFRILLGLLLIYNFIEYRIIPSPEFLMPSNGIFGNEFLSKDSTVNTWSIFRWVTTDFLHYISIAITMIVYFLYTIGYRSRISSIIAYFLFWQWQQRYFVLDCGWERYIGALLFLSIFIQIGENFSLDARMRTDKIVPTEDKSPFAYIMLMQIGVIYFFAAINKNGSLWLNGDAVRYLIADFVFARSSADWLLQNDGLAKIGTYSTLLIEGLIIFLLFWPKAKHLRLLAAILIVSLHWTINIFSDIGHFRYISICVGALLIPGYVWEIYAKKYRREISLPFIKNEAYRTGYWVLAFVLIWIMWVHNFKKLGEKDTFVGRFMINTGIQRILEIASVPSFDVSSWLKQGWSYYSPQPPMFSGVYGIEATTQTGQTLQVLPPPSFSEEHPPFKLNYSCELEKYFLIKSRLINSRGYQQLRYYWAQKKTHQYCRQKNIDETQLDKINLYYYVSYHDEVRSLRKMTIYREPEVILNPIY